MSVTTTRLRVKVARWIASSVGVATILTVSVLFLLPMRLSNFQLSLAGSALIIATMAVTWDFFTGLSGYFSFGHMFLIALGGYSSVLLEAEVGLSIWLSIVAATVITTVVGTVFIAVPSLRLTGIYFAAVTLIIAIWGENVVVLFSDITGGRGGYIFVADLGFELTDTLPIAVDESIMLYYVVVGIFLLTLGTLTIVAKSQLGLTLKAIRDNELLLASLGVDPTKFKVTGFGLTAFFAGFVGAIWTHYLTALNPATQLSIGTMIDIIVAAVIGGVGTLVGPAIGIFILEFIDWLLTTVESGGFIRDTLGVGFNITEFRRVIWMGIALAFFYFYPRGLYPAIKDNIRQLDPRGDDGERE